MTRFADDYVKFRAASQRYGSKVHALGAGAPPRAQSSPHEGRIIPKRSRRSHGWRTWGQPFAMHRRELTALSTAARTRVHIRDASPRADSAFYSADPRPYITSACCTSRQRYEGQQTPWEQLACPALLRTVRYLRHGGPSRRRPIAYTQHMQSATPPARGHDTIATTAGGSTARPTPRPPRRCRHPSHFPLATTTTTYPSPSHIIVLCERFRGLSHGTSELWLEDSVGGKPMPLEMRRRRARRWAARSTMRVRPLRGSVEQCSSTAW